MLPHDPSLYLVLAAGGAESIRERSPLPSEESDRRAGVAAERVRQSKRVLHLYFLFSFHPLTHLSRGRTPTHLMLRVCSRVTPLSARLASRPEGDVYRSLSRERRSGYGALRARSGSRERPEDRRQRSEERGRRADSSGPRARIPRPSPSPTGTARHFLVGLFQHTQQQVCVAILVTHTAAGLDRSCTVQSLCYIALLSLS